MLSKKKRADRKDIEQIFKDTRFISSQHLTLKFVLAKKKDLPRISFVVPKTVVKRATGRNLLRRRGYAVLEKYLNKFPPGFKGIFVFGKKSIEIFGQRKNKGKNKTQDLAIELKHEIEIILNKLWNIYL